MLLQGFCKLLLFLTGWTISEESKRKLRLIHRGVVVFPHTSKWDSLVGLMINQAYLDDINAMAPIYYTYMGTPGSFKYNMLQSLGLFPINGDVPGGTVQCISDTLNAKKRFVLFISPEGQCKKVTRMKTGYWHIANNTNSSLTVLNLDYHNHRLVVGPTWWPTDLAQDTLYIENCFSVHSPLFPFEAHYAEHHKIPDDPIQWDRILIFLLVIFCLKIYFDVQKGSNIFENYQKKIYWVPKTHLINCSN